MYSEQFGYTILETTEYEEDSCDRQRQPNRTSSALLVHDFRPVLFGTGRHACPIDWCVQVDINAAEVEELKAPTVEIAYPQARNRG